MKRIIRGLNIPITGEPAQDIHNGPEISQVGILGDDFIGMKPTMLVQAGDIVKLGQPVFTDKKTDGVVFTAPAAGKVVDVNRGQKRKFESLVIDVHGNDEITFQSFDNLQDVSSEKVREQLVASGMWTCLRTRPYNRTPRLDQEPHSVFVTAMDTNPLSAEPELIIEQNKDWFIAGLTVVSKLTRGKTFVCTRDHSRIPGQNVPNVTFESFAGPHPAGLPGTHIHFLDPVSPKKSVWFLNYQDVIAIGHLFTTGRIMTERVIALGGPRVQKPALLKTRLGANIDQITKDRANLKNARVVSGSLLSGRVANAPHQFLGRFHLQVSVLEEGNHREFLGWQMPGTNKFSITNIYLGSLLGKKFDMTTNLNGGHRAMVPVGTYERVMPLDILPTQLLRALIVEDTEEAQLLGCLELDEDDLGLCTYVCPGKYDFGKILRSNLTRIEKEG
ncbi:MAG: Na(+)-translocating NADH-quinone reductase subunit A [Pirellulaceae bacterium]